MLTRQARLTLCLRRTVIFAHAAHPPTLTDDGTNDWAVCPVEPCASVRRTLIYALEGDG